MPEPSTPAAYLARFGVFELNLRSGELRKAGTRISLQELVRNDGDLMLIENFR